MFSNIFDFVVGFGGSGTLPTVVASAVRGFVVQCGLYGTGDIWASVCNMLTSNNEVLNYTTLVILYAVEVNGERQVESRQITKHAPPYHAFGYQFKACGTPGCNPNIHDITVHTSRQKVQLQCTKCNWRSGKVRSDTSNEYFKQVNPMKAPLLFWHHFPPSPALQNLFVSVARSMPTPRVEQSERGVAGKEARKQNHSRKRRRTSTADVGEHDAMDLS